MEAFSHFLASALKSEIHQFQFFFCFPPDNILAISSLPSWTNFQPYFPLSPSSSIGFSHDPSLSGSPLKGICQTAGKCGCSRPENRAGRSMLISPEFLAVFHSVFIIFFFLLLLLLVVKVMSDICFLLLLSTVYCSFI